MDEFKAKAEADQAIDYFIEQWENNPSTLEVRVCEADAEIPYDV